MAAIELKEPTQPIENVLETAVRIYLDERERQAIHAETQIFWATHDELLRTYLGQHVAFYQGQVVDHDKDVSRLEKRIRERFGLLPVLIAPVSPSGRRDLHWLGGRFEPVA